MKFSKIFIISISILITSFLPVQADEFSEFDAEMKSYETLDLKKESADYAKFARNYLNEYDNWRSQYLKGFDKKQAKVIEKWGGGDVSQKRKNVEYFENSTLKSVVDYAAGTVTVEVLVDNSLLPSQAQEVLERKVSQLIDTRSSNLFSLDMKKIIIEPENIVISPIEYTKLEEEKAKSIIAVQTNAYLQDVDKDADKLMLVNSSISPEVVERLVMQKKEKLQKEADTRRLAITSRYKKLRSSKFLNKNKSSTQKTTSFKIVKYKVKLPKNSLAKRAKKYKAFAEKYSKRFNISAGLVMAIMHCESAFDPNAKSPIPAYGLMQIVPRTAGHDVNRIIHKLDRPMKASELYIPDVNVATGTAYLSILKGKYLKSIKDPVSRLYCVIAAYNTGAGNVAKVFNKKGNTRNIKRASKVINKLSPQEVYAALMKSLPYAETKHYLKRVYGHISLYEI